VVQFTLLVQGQLATGMEDMDTGMAMDMNNTNIMGKNIMDMGKEGRKIMALAMEKSIVSNMEMNNKAMDIMKKVEGLKMREEMKIMERKATNCIKIIT